MFVTKRIASFALLLMLVLPARAQAAHSAVLSWGASSDAAANPSLSYNVYKLSAACPATGTTGFSKVNTTQISALTFTDSSLSIGPVCFYVTAILNGAESVPSNTAGGTVGPQTVILKITLQ